MSSVGDVGSMFDLCVGLYRDNPVHIVVEALCVGIIIYLLTQRSFRKAEQPLTEQEIDEMVREWKPAPLHPSQPLGNAKPVVVDGMVGPKVTVNKKEVINFACNDFLGLNGHKTIQDKAAAALDKYGCGSCGPRGFYGTLDVHLELEKSVAKFMGFEKSIVYSADIATVSSTIPTFSKAGDLLICDEGVGFQIQEGCKLSRSKVVLFKHNDMGDLERKLQEVVNADKTGKKHKLNRRFIVIEALYQNFGDVAPLQRIVELKKKYRFRLILDESFSLGVLGKTGRGLTDEAGVNPSEVDILTGSLSNSVASLGGFCVGSNQVVDHQRLSGNGYVFSASAPPYLCVAAMMALDLISSDPKRIATLRERIQQLRAGLAKVVTTHHYVKMLGHDKSPVVVLSLPNQPESDALAATLFEELLSRGLLVTVLRSSVGERRLVSGVRLHVMSTHTKEDIDQAIAIVTAAMDKVLRQGKN